MRDSITHVRIAHSPSPSQELVGVGSAFSLNVRSTCIVTLLFRAGRVQYRDQPHEGKADVFCITGFRGDIFLPRSPRCLNPRSLSKKLWSRTSGEVSIAGLTLFNAYLPRTMICGWDIRRSLQSAGGLGVHNKIDRARIRKLFVCVWQPRRGVEEDQEGRQVAIS